MPNWCNNVLTVTGTPTAMRSFERILITQKTKNDQAFNFEAFVPGGESSWGTRGCCECDIFWESPCGVAGAQLNWINVLVATQPSLNGYDKLIIICNSAWTPYVD